MHVLPPYRQPGSHHPVADLLSSRGIVLPMHGLLSDDDICHIAERLAHYCKYADAAPVA